MVIVLEDFIPTSWNVLLGWHWRKRSAYNSETKELLCALLHKYKSQAIKQYPIDIHYTIIKKDKRLGDSDNFSGKVVTDSLVAAGIIEGDSTKYVRRFSYQLEYGEKNQTVITLSTPPSF